jgi:hypothetical protein
MIRLMGCDYYTQVVLTVVYLDADGKQQSLQKREQRQPRYSCSSHDPDTDEPINDLEEEINNYGTKILYENKTWKCTAHGRERVENLCASNKVPIDSMISASKYLSGWWR